ncbi:helix-turn-helix domain-containing protein [Mycobacterium paragordonae]|uniref:helix-turn-helix domain-containing protein n=1 Tax=Mycobacterium paragordonae TaxID=1389713 RepID=UPI0014077F0C|nr:helix-turn-helix transcriptional regulator [Mycobacterium paragordonae]
MSHPDIAGTVRAELARQRKSQQELQSRLGVSRATMRRRLTGEQPFDANELIIVADFLGLAASELFGETKASA